LRINVSYATITHRFEKDVGKILSVISSIGYKGIELVDAHYGQYFDKPVELSRLIASHELRAVAIAKHANLTDQATYRGAVDSLKKLGDFASSAGFEKILFAETPMEGRRGERHFKMLADALNEIGGYVKDRGVHLTFHPHTKTTVERREHIDKFFKLVETERVGFCLDTAHLTGAGVDLPKLVLEYCDRISYVHLKDIRTESSLSWDRRFVELGSGDVDFPAVFEAFEKIGYSGWHSVELDNSPDPDKSAKASWRYLKKLGVV